MTPPPTSAWSRRRERFSMVIAVVLILNFHYLLLYFATRFGTTNELYLHSLLLLTLPGLFGSFQNLKHYQRWASYYFIWFQIWRDTILFRNISPILFDMLIFATMEAIFQRHLRVIAGGVSVPRIVYYSSWVSNSRLDAYLATYRVEDNSTNDNKDISEKDTAAAASTTTITTMTATTATTAMTLKTKLAYLLVTIVLLLNIYQEILQRIQEAFCSYNPIAIETRLDTILNMTVIDFKPQYQSYCHPPPSSFETTLWYHFPFLYKSFPSFPVILARLSALLYALAWSAVPTDVITTAWTQMWNSPSSRLRKIHYILFMLPIKFLALVLIVRNTPALDDNFISSRTGSSLIRVEYRMYWFFVFRAATKLAFGLGFIWNLYVAHANGHRRVMDRLEETEENENENELLL